MLEALWDKAVGQPYCCQTRVGDLRRGVLTVIVTHSALLQELSAFRKAELLDALRSNDMELSIRDIRFRIGPVDRLRELPSGQPGDGR